MTTRIPPPASEERLPRFDTPNILWFFGGITTAAMSTALVGAVSPSSRGVWTFLVALLLMAIYAALAMVLRLSRWWVPGGVLAAVFVSLVPSLGIGFERLIGVLPSGGSGTSSVAVAGTATSTSTYEGFRGSLFALALATVATGLIVFALTDFAFVLAPVTLAALFSALLFLPAVDDQATPSDVATTAIVTGAVLVGVGLLLDAKRRRRAAFWWHVVGLAAVAYGLAYFVGSQHDEGAWAAMLVTGIVVLLGGAVLGRATWALYGIAGAYVPLVHYAGGSGGTWRVPLVLVLVGLAALSLGFLVHMYGGAWSAWGRARLGR
jgi:hypothetical protein